MAKKFSELEGINVFPQNNIVDRTETQSKTFLRCKKQLSSNFYAIGNRFTNYKLQAVKGTRIC